jgi:hypothetical protein
MLLQAYQVTNYTGPGICIDRTPLCEGFLQGGDVGSPGGAERELFRLTRAIMPFDIR